MTYQRITLIYFFFQAEDDIRDLYVTGVQTCALPICERPARARHCDRANARRTPCGSHWPRGPGRRGGKPRKPGDRSEERRVGKECRFRWLACPWKKRYEGAVSDLFLPIAFRY